jgi:FkbM family methyltransferase
MTMTGYFTTEDGVCFLRCTTSSRQIYEVPEYRFSDIGPDDRVIDIGANVGAFCLRAARMSERVMAVEPVMTSILEENIRLNQAGIRVLVAGLGTGAPARCTWDEHSAVVPTYPLQTLIRMAGGCDFLKCDCEGAEWLIRPEDLDGVRRIEMELHLPPISGPPEMKLLDYISHHYDFEIERKPCHDVMGVMGILHAKRR